jgi:glycosyltransferase involved in cell wall biosynthesis
MSVIKAGTVSICIPTYNSEETIEATLRGALSQDWPSIEIIVSDDASTDGTVRKIAELGDERVRLMRNERNLGLVGNWNASVRYSSGEFVKLLPADDVIASTCVSREARALQGNQGCSFTVCYTNILDAAGAIVAKSAWRLGGPGVQDARRNALRSVRTYNHFGSPVNVLFRRRDFDAIGGFDPAFPFCADYDMWLMLCYKGSVFVIDDYLASFRTRPQSNTSVVMSKKRAQWRREHVRMIQKHARLGIIKLGSLDIASHVVFRVLRTFAVSVFLRLTPLLSWARARGLKGGRFQ